MNFSTYISTVNDRATDVEVKVAILKDLLMNEAMDNFTVVPNMKKGMRQPTWTASSGQKNYSPTFEGVKSEVLSAKKFDLYEGKIEHVVEQKEYEDAWEAFALQGGYDKESVTEFAEWTLTRFAAIEKEEFRNNVIWNAAYSSGGTTSLTQMNGFKTIIANAITAGTLPSAQVVTTGAITAANVLASVKNVISKVGRKYRRQKDFVVLVSEDVLSMYIDAYEDANPNRTLRTLMKATLDGGVDGTGANATNQSERIAGVYLAGSLAGVLMKEEVGMTLANSQRIIATCMSNLQVGTSMPDFENYTFKIKENHYTADIFMRYEVGCNIYELGDFAIAVNNVA